MSLLAFAKRFGVPGNSKAAIYQGFRSRFTAPTSTPHTHLLAPPPPPPPPPSTRPPKHQLNRVRDRRKQIDEMQQQLRTRSTPMSRKSYSVKKDLNNTGRRHRPQQVKNRRVPSTVSAGDRRKQYLKRRNKMNRTTIKKKNSTLNNRKRKVKSDMRTPPPPPSSTVSKSGSRSSNTKTRRPRKVVVEDKTDSAIRSYITRRMRQVSRG